jgi:MFS family permease
MQDTVRSFQYLGFLGITALLCGAVVMVVEVVGARIISPFFGVSLFVWTSLIAVTLISLSLGYVLGGILADRKPYASVMYLLIFVAGLAVMAIPFLKGFVLVRSIGVGLRAGSLLSATVLFAPSLLLLGCVSPYLVRLSARELRSFGRLVGIFYAISTAGSFLGTLFAGFILLAYLGVDEIMYLSGGILIVLFAVYFAFFRKTAWAFLALAIMLVPLVTAKASPEVLMRDGGTKVEKIYHHYGYYGNLAVLDFSYGAARTREMLIDGLVQTGIDTVTGLSTYGYPYYLEFLPYALHPEGSNCLVIGLGGGTVPMWYERRGVVADVLDVNPDVPGVAAKYFGFKVSGKTIIADARHYLETSTTTYDYLILDVFTGDTTPGHLLTREALEAASRRLSPKGILAINLMGRLGEEGYMTASVVATLESVYEHVDVFPTFPVGGDVDHGNIVILAYDYDFAGYDRSVASRFVSHPFVKGQVETMFQKYEFPQDTSAMILTDNYNPIDFYDTWLKEEIRAKIMREKDIVGLLL